MEVTISNLVSRFEKGLLSRRELVRGLAMLAAGGTAASAQEGLNFRTATIDHVSIQVADLKRSSEFYQMMFGFREVSGEPARNILRLGNTRTLVSLNLEKPTATVDHFAIGIPRYSKDAAMRYFTERGVSRAWASDAASMMTTSPPKNESHHIVCQSSGLFRP